MDNWGVQADYVDGSDVLRRCDPDTVTRVRAMVGSAGSAGPLIVGATDTDLGPGVLRTEDGRELRVGDRTAVPLPLGYHDLVGDDGTERAVIVSPRMCATADRRWGWAVQLPGLRSASSWGIGDLGDLARLGRWSRGVGAACLLVNPIGAVAPVDRQEPSPYYPTTRRFRNPLYLRVEDVPLADRAGPAMARAQGLGRALNETDSIDRDAVWRVKREALEAIWAAGPAPEEFERWLEAQPHGLHRFATWCVLAERHGGDFTGWPAEFHHPDDPAVAVVAAEHRDRVRFHAWLQWAVELQIEACRSAISRIEDLPVGFDPSGFDAWEWQDQLALDMSIGAPPDPFNRSGQSWGLPPFEPSALRAAGYRPFIDTLRAAMAGAGGLRIDHILGFFRLWWVPEGRSPDAGCYVRYPADDLLAILALESHRNDVPVVGEDLGTVEKGVRSALRAHEVLSYRVLWFEQDPPSRWTEPTAGAITTHDLPTVAGVWTGADADHQRAAGLSPDTAALTDMRRHLAGVADLGGDESTDEAIVAAHRALAAAPSRLLAATLEDAVGESARPNLPGTMVDTNWSRPLPVALEALETHPLAARIAAVLTESIADSSAVRPAPRPDASPPGGSDQR